jgi:hypothetical protein
MGRRLFTRQVVLPVKMSNGPSKDVRSKLLTLPDCPITPLGYSCFSLILAGRLPAVTSDAPATDVLNIAQTT